MDPTQSLFDLSGKTCLVTGSTRGLGKAIALGLGKAGANIVICSRSAKDVERVALDMAEMGIDAQGIASDVTDRAQCQALIDATISHFGQLDVLVANHGGGVDQRVPALEETPASWDSVLALNLTGAFHCCQLAAKQIVAQGGGGSIVVVSSTSAHLAHPNLLAYGAAKAGLNQLVRQMAFELGPEHIRVNAISVGFTTHRPRAPKVDPGSQFDRAINTRTPLGRSGEPHEFAGPVIFLASDASSYITGATLPVDGGYMVA